MSPTFENDTRLILDGRHGVYIPQLFCEDITEEECNSLSIEWSDVRCCQSGPDEEWYWEAWDNIERDLLFTDSKGQQWRIYQNGDLWEVPANCEISEDF